MSVGRWVLCFRLSPSSTLYTPHPITPLRGGEERAGFYTLHSTLYITSSLHHSITSSGPGPWSRTDPCKMGAVGDPDCQVVLHADLAGESISGDQFRILQRLPLQVAHRRDLAGEDLHTAGGAARIAAAAMQNIDAIVFQTE